jgi:hypothetical protein
MGFPPSSFPTTNKALGWFEHSAFGERLKPAFACRAKGGIGFDCRDELTGDS